VGQISVIIPSYNRAGLIRQTIENLLNQTQPPLEIIVVDDGSTDDSVRVIRSFGSAVRLFEQKNQGPGAARNEGLRMAAGEFIQFQDSDDLYSLNKLESQSKLLEQTGADIAFGPWAHVFIQEQKLKFQTCVLQQSLPPTKINLACWQLRGWSTVFQSLMFRRSFLINIGGYKTDMRYGEDMEFFFRILLQSPRVAFAPDTLTLYRVNSSNNLSEDGASQYNRIVDWSRCLQRISENLKKMCPDADDLSRAIFFSGIRKHLRYFRAVPAAPPDLLRELTGLVAQWPAWYLQAVEVWLRMAERMRLLRTGWRWMPGYQAGSLTQGQRELIAGLGFGITQ